MMLQVKLLRTKMALKAFDFVVNSLGMTPVVILFGENFVANRTLNRKESVREIKWKEKQCKIYITSNLSLVVSGSFLPIYGSL